jgi:hypothetical protein
MPAKETFALKNIAAPAVAISVQRLAQLLCSRLWCA